MKKQKLLAAGIAVLTIANIAIVLGCRFGGPAQPETMVSTDDLSGHDVYIYNATCPDVFRHRTVEDADFIGEIAEICARATPFRPGTTSDMILGIDITHVHVKFENETDVYLFSLLTGIINKINSGSAHRDSPALSVSKDVFDDAGRRIEEIWCFCTLSAADYAALYELLASYSGGEII